MWKKIANKMVVKTIPKPNTEDGKSSWVRNTVTVVVLPRLNISTIARFIILLTTLDMVNKPITPAMASIPIPI